MTSETSVQAIDPDAVAAGREAVPHDAVLTGVVDAFAALADPTRARMLYALIRQPLCVRDLALVVGISESGVSHQLRLLRDRRLVKGQRRGNLLVYAVDGHHVASLFREAEFHADHVRSGTPDHPYRGT